MHLRNPYQSPQSAEPIDAPIGLPVLERGESTRRLNASVLGALVYGPALVFLTGSIVLAVGGPRHDFGPLSVLLNSLMIGVPFGCLAAVPTALGSLLTLAIRVYWLRRPAGPTRRAWVIGALVAGAVWVTAFLLQWTLSEPWSRYPLLIAAPIPLYAFVFGWGTMPPPHVEWFEDPKTFWAACLLVHLCAGAVAGAVYGFLVRPQVTAEIPVLPQ